MVPSEDGIKSCFSVRTGDRLHKLMRKRHRVRMRERPHEMREKRHCVSMVERPHEIMGKRHQDDGDKVLDEDER